MAYKLIVKRSVSFGLGLLVLGIAEMLWSYLFAAVTWEGMRVIALWLIPAFVVPTAATGSVGFAAGLWMAQLARRTPRTRFLGWWALGLGAAFFHSLMEVIRALRLFEAPMQTILFVMGVAVPVAAAIMAVGFVFVGTRA